MIKNKKQAQVKTNLLKRTKHIMVVECLNIKCIQMRKLKKYHLECKEYQITIEVLYFKNQNHLLMT
jgi:hypothetical protein